jgi:hypothetical protein
MENATLATMKIKKKDDDTLIYEEHNINTGTKN